MSAVNTRFILLGEHYYIIYYYCDVLLAPVNIFSFFFIFRKP